MSYFTSVGITDPLTGFGELLVTERTPVVELKSNYGSSNIRDITTVTGTGAVGNSAGEYSVSTGATTASTAGLASAERGRYQPGAQAQAGIGVRLPATTYTGTAEARWGYFDTDNGFGFGIDATSPFVFTRRAGADTDVAQADWNRDTLNGNGPSGVTLDLTKGNIFQIDFSWYGYGVIQYKVVLPNTSGRQTSIVVHEFTPVAQTSVVDPNLPINVVTSNGDTTTNYVAYVGGRQFSVLTKFEPNRRINGNRRLSQGSIGTTFVPLISFRRKSAFRSVSVKIDGFDIITDQALVWEIRSGVEVADLTGESFGTPVNTTAAETAVESDIAATAVTNASGEFIAGGIVNATGSGNKASGSFSTDQLQFDVPDLQIITLQARSISGTATVSSFFRWKEEW